MWGHMSKSSLQVLLLCFSVLFWSCSSPTETKEQSTESLISTHLAQLYSRFQTEYPGRGVTDYPGHTIDDIPKSYAKVLLGELDRQGVDSFAAWPDLAVNSGYWLLHNSDANNDGVVGWGVPIAWDAYGDGSINPANTEYSITTGIVIDALLEWMERGPGSPKQKIINTISKAISPYLSQDVLSPSGMLPYSLQVEDRKYDTFNSAAYLAGQIQRFSKYLEDEVLKARMENVADMTMQALLNHVERSPETSAWYWDYSIQEDSPNDLPHASYIVLGIDTYVKNGGRLAEKFDMPSVYAHLNEFIPKSSTGFIRGWPRFKKEINGPARSYDVGMAMSLSCQIPNLSNLTEPLVSAVESYRADDGSYLRHPKGTEGFDELSIAEYEAYLYHGLANCAYAGAKEKGKTPVAIRLSGNASDHKEFDTIRQNATGFMKIPGLNLVSDEAKHDVEFNIDTYRSILTLDGHPPIIFPQNGIPVWVEKVDSLSYAIFFRSIPDGKLSLFQYQKEGKILIKSEIATISDAELMFRSARWHNGQLYVVAYDNPSLHNYLIRFSPTREGFMQVGESVKLPLLEDPAGGTYEMIPAVFFAKHNNDLYVIGGTLKSKISEIGEASETRIENCLKAIEIAETPFGPAVLCQSKNQPNFSQPYFIDSPGDLVAPDLSTSEVFWNLRFNNGTLQIKQAKNPSDYTELFAYDLARIQQKGWMEFGIDNSEGRIPWSQIYYLNGFLDVLLLAQLDNSFCEQMKPLLPVIRQRLDMELKIIDDIWGLGRYKTRAFSIDRSPELFAVQTSRLLLLMQRYLDEVDQPIVLRSYRDVKKTVYSLKDHIEVLAYSGESERWIEPGKPHLRWPKGSKFYYDGTPVPFNHQNEWAYSIISTFDKRTDLPETKLDDALDIIDFFINRITKKGEFPRNGEWDYWWGTARDGWAAEDGISINTPEYVGDKIKAWISFRSIDAMSTLSASEYFEPEVRTRSIHSISSLVSRGLLYPFVGYELVRRGEPITLTKNVALQYIRFSSPWEIQNAAWAQLYFSHTGAKTSSP